MKIKSVDVEFKSWKDKALIKSVRAATVPELNAIAKEAADLAAQYSPVLTGRLASEMEVIQEATEQKPEALYGNVKTPYAIWVEVGSQGRPGKYMIRRAMEQVNSRALRKMKDKL